MKLNLLLKCLKMEISISKVGRRGALLYNNIICFIAAALMGLAKSAGAYPMIILGRFFIGLNCGKKQGCAEFRRLFLFSRAHSVSRGWVSRPSAFSSRNSD